MNSFDDFKRKLDTNTPEAWEKLRLNVATVIDHWCREKYLEVCWTVKDEKVLKGQEFYQLVFNTLQKNYSTYKLRIKEYADLKGIFVEITEILLNNGFREFIIKLSQNNEQAWKIVDARLRIFIKGWLLKKGYCSDDDFQAIYYNTLSFFVEKFATGELEFLDSKKLKSYFLSIAENKRKEYFRTLNSKRFEPFDLQKVDLPFEFNSSIEEKQWKEQLKLGISTLNHNERTIIYGVFFYKMMLKELAKVLDISEEACRVAKLRALRKLQELYTKEPV